MFIRSNYLIIAFIVSLFLNNYRSIDINQEEYAFLNIPAIQLKEKIFSKYSKYNNLKYGLYLSPFSMEIEEEKAQIIIAAHSGNAKISYFKNLDKLKINDEIKIQTAQNIYLFRVIDIYSDKKDGNVKIKKYNTKSLSLVTCQKNTNDLHLIISAIYSGKIEK